MNFNQIKQFMIDMDGVLWRGETPMPGLAHFFETLKFHGFPFVLATNNASKTPTQYVQKFEKFGVPVSKSQILTSAIATADYLKDEYEPGTAVYISGGLGLHQAMEASGFHILSKTDIRKGALADLVVVGLNQQTTYEDLAAAAIGLNKGARFIGTNPDVTYPSEWGNLPGAGSLLALLRTATGHTPTIIGKPNRPMFIEGLKRLQTTAKTAAMIGDRLETDIAGAQQVGLKSILVLSGITQKDELPGASVQPDFVFENIEEISRVINS